MKNQSKQNLQGEAGFSILEMIAVMTIIMIMSAVSIWIFTAQRKLYHTDEQALMMVDLLQEAKQRSLTQREIIRVEFDLEDNLGRMIDENQPNDPTDDVIVRQITLFQPHTVEISAKPTNVTLAVPETLPVPDVEFRGSLHPESAGHEVATIRFARNGAALDTGSNAAGANAVPKGATIYIWKPKDGSPNQATITKAITVLGATGSVRMWDFIDDGAESYWKDSRRASYGGGN